MQEKQSAIALLLFDNSEPDLQLVAECILNQEHSIYEPAIWSQIVGEHMTEDEMGAIHQNIYAGSRAAIAIERSLQHRKLRE